MVHDATHVLVRLLFCCGNWQLVSPLAPHKFAIGHFVLIKLQLINYSPFLISVGLPPLVTILCK